MGKVQEHIVEHNVDEQAVVHRPKRLVKTLEASWVSGMSKSFLDHNWRTMGGARRAGRALRWDVDELLEWMKQQAQEN